jgi:hypothetical protein
VNLVGGLVGEGPDADLGGPRPEETLLDEALEVIDHLAGHLAERGPACSGNG